VAEKLTPDLCVIGAGAAGLSLAAAAATLGVPVVLVEKGRLGGEHLNTGCVPSKAMIAAGNRAEAMRAAAPFGVKSTTPTIEFDEVNDHIHRVISAVAPNDAKERIAGFGVRVIEGEARFLDGKTVVVGPEPDIKFEIKARRFVIATGSRPIVPTISGIEQVPYLTNENAFETRERPKHLKTRWGETPNKEWCTTNSAWFIATWVPAARPRHTSNRPSQTGSRIKLSR